MDNAKTPMDEGQAHKLMYKGNEDAWRFINGKWKTNDEGDIISPTLSHWSLVSHLAFNVEHAYGDCELSGQWRLIYAGGGTPEFVVRAMDSRRYYAVRFNLMMNLPADTHMLMCSIWKGCGDGYTRMLGHRRKVGVYRNITHPNEWFSVRVVCKGPEILVYFNDYFVCAVSDEEYAQGCVGVSGGEFGSLMFRNMEVKGTTTTSNWTMVDDALPDLFEPMPGTAIGAEATLLPDNEVLVGYNIDENTQVITRTRDYAQTWDEPVPGKFGYYIKGHDEMWAIQWEHKPDVIWEDRGTNFDELNMDNFWTTATVSKDRGKTWSDKYHLDIPFPQGTAYQSIPGKAGSMYMSQSPVALIGDGALGMSTMWRNNPDGNYHSDQVFFCRSTDDGQTWTTISVDDTEWERNESAWLELDDGKIIMLLRSNYTNSVGVSWSYDYGLTWTRVRPLGIPYFGASAPAIIRTCDNVLVIAVRMWGILTSIDEGLTWSLPTHIGGYTGEGGGANMMEMTDGRILILGSDHGNARDRCRTRAQFIRVTPDGMVNPAPRGPER